MALLAATVLTAAGLAVPEANAATVTATVAAERQAAEARRDTGDFFTDATITGYGPGRTVTTAYNGPSSLNPLHGYPTSLPAGSTPHGATRAGLIRLTDRGPEHRTALAYCIDLNTRTMVGVNYKLGDWNAVNVPNVGYIGYILHHYYPMTSQPAGAGSAASRAAVVQLAIWFFADKLVLAPTDPAYSLVSGIVTDALAHGPSTEPARPHVSVRPTTMQVIDGRLAGPFRVYANGPSTLETHGVNVYTDPRGHNQLHDGDTVLPGQRLWVRSVSGARPQGFVLNRTAEVNESAVYLYDHTNPGIDHAQKLVLAQRQRLTTRAGATITRGHDHGRGSLRVVKTVLGNGAGLQGRITIKARCTPPHGGTQNRTFHVAAHARRGNHQAGVWRGLPGGTRCTVTETGAGENHRAFLRHMHGSPVTVTIPWHGTKTVRITDIYECIPGPVK